MTIKQQQPDIIVGLDIGTSKVAAIIGRLNNNEIEVLAVGQHSSEGMQKGVVVDIRSTVKSIQHAIDEAERISGYQVQEVYVGIAGSHISGGDSTGMVAISGKDVELSDVNRVIDLAKTGTKIAADNRLIHILPQEFMIDGQCGIIEPIGMAGQRLEVKAHIITGSTGALLNIEKCVNNCGLDVKDIILEQLASSEAVLTEPEKKLGVCLVDIGGGTTDIAIFHNGTIRHTAVIPVAGAQVTGDITIAFNTTISAAENIKRKHACAVSELIKQDEDIEVPSVGDRPAQCLSRSILVDVVEQRYAELFQLIRKELNKSGLEHMLVAGIVLTGGGSLVEGAVELAESIFDEPVRLGYPQGMKGLQEQSNNPAYATTVGLLKYAKEHTGKKIDKLSNSWLEKIKHLFRKF